MHNTSGKLEYHSYVRKTPYCLIIEIDYKRCKEKIRFSGYFSLCIDTVSLKYRIHESFTSIWKSMARNSYLHMSFSYVFRNSHNYSALSVLFFAEQPRYARKYSME